MTLEQIEICNLNKKIAQLAEYNEILKRLQVSDTWIAEQLSLVEELKHNHNVYTHFHFFSIYRYSYKYWSGRSKAIISDFSVLCSYVKTLPH